MNKTKLKKVIGLYKDGVEPRVCVLALLQMCCTQNTSGVTFHRDTAKWIDDFYNIINNFPGTELEEV